MCERSLCEVLQSVVAGADGCVLSFGQTKVGTCECVYCINALATRFRGHKGEALFSALHLDLGHVLFFHFKINK